MRKFLLLIFLTLFFSCKEKVVVIPDTVLQKDSMIAVLVDIQLTEATHIKNAVNTQSPQDSLNFLKEYAILFKNHKISQEQFEKSYNFYKDNPLLLEEIYDNVINELSKLQAMVGNINTANSELLKKKIKEGTPFVPPQKILKKNSPGEKK